MIVPGLLLVFACNLYDSYTSPINRNTGLERGLEISGIQAMAATQEFSGTLLWDAEPLAQFGINGSWTLTDDGSTLVSAMSVESTSSGQLVAAVGIEVLVSTTAELITALGNATGGETILLTAGNYDDLNIYDLNFASSVTIKSQNPLQAVFATIIVKNSSNIIFDSIHIEHIRTVGESESVIALKIRESNNISLINSELNGSVDGIYDNDVVLLNVYQSQNITIADNVFHDGTRGSIFNIVDQLTVTGNQLFDIRSDGFDFVAVRGVLIEGNSFTDFHPAALDHPDAIQFWSTNAPYDSSDVVIRNNTMLQGNGDVFQSIFISNALAGGGFSDFTIEGNVIYNGSIHGISVYNGANIRITNNTVLAFPGSSSDPVILLKTPGLGVIVENNITMAISVPGGVAVTLIGNVIAQDSDPGEWNYTGNLVADAFAGALATRDSFITLPGLSPDGLIDFSLVGAVPYDNMPSELAAFITSEAYLGTSDSLAVSFDASLSADSAGATGGTASYLWDFGDGTTAAGLQVNHTYQQGGDYVVTLTITKDGVSDVFQKTVMPVHPLVLDVDHISDLSAAVLIGDVADAGGALEFDGDSYANFGRDQSFFGMQEFNLSLDFKASGDGAGGREILIWNHVRYGIRLDGDDIQFNLWTDTGEAISLIVKNTNIRDGAWHSVSLSFDASSGTIVGLLDGVEVVRQEGVTGAIKGSESWDLTLGGASFGDEFTGLIDNVQIWTSADATVGDGSDIGGGNAVPVEFSSVFAGLLALAVDRAAQSGDGISPANFGEFTIVQSDNLVVADTYDLADLLAEYDPGDYYGGFISTDLIHLY